MKFCNLIGAKIILSDFIIFILFLINFVKYASTLKTENLVGGRAANQRSYKYQVGIIAKRNYSDIYVLICGGGIIADNFVLSAAHCFIEQRIYLRQFSFLVTAGHTQIYSLRTIKRNVRTIYIPADYDPITSLGDLAVLKVEGFGISPYVNKLNLPTNDTAFTLNVGKIAGFGYYWVKIAAKLSGAREKIDGGTDFMLRYAMIDVLEGSACKSVIPTVDTNKQFCGFSRPYFPHMYTGACTGDTGGPLVFNNTIGAILVKSPIDCYDTIEGSIYNKVFSYTEFINAIIAGMPTANTRAYHNRPHIFKV